MNRIGKTTHNCQCVPGLHQHLTKLRVGGLDVHNIGYLLPMYNILHLWGALVDVFYICTVIVYVCAGIRIAVLKLK